MGVPRTLVDQVSLEGIGLHSGVSVRVDLSPAAPGSGIVFVRVDLPGSPSVRACLENLVERPRRTALVCGTAEVHTIEHLMASLWAHGITDLEVRLDGAELPGLDGSALEYFAAIDAVGTADLPGRHRSIEVSAPVKVSRGDATIIALPVEGGGLRISYTLDYSASGWGAQYFSAVVDRDVFAREIAPARTFCLESEAEALRAAGLGLGATTGNTLVLGRDGQVIDNEFRFPDELVRHKVLDLLGDLYLSGGFLRGHVLATKSGHHLNVELARQVAPMRSNGCVTVAGATVTGPTVAGPTVAGPTVAGPTVAGPTVGGAEPRERGAAGSASSRPVSPRSDGASAGGDGSGTPDSGRDRPTSGRGLAAPLARERTLSIHEVSRSLPHSFPFLFVDRVIDISADGRSARGLKNVTVNEEYFVGHFPGNPVMPGVLQLEGMAQLAGLMLLSHEQNAGKLAYLLSLDGVKFRRPVVPGDQLVYEAVLVAMKPRTARVDVRTTVDGQLTAEAHIRFMLVSEGD